MKRQRGFTIFDVFSVCGALVGLIDGGSYGFEHFGPVGAVVAAVMGGYMGFLLGRVPFALGLWWMQRSLNRQSSQRLRERVRGGREYYISHLLLAHLMKRGEDVNDEFPAILNLLKSESNDRRRFGWTALRLAFPDRASRIGEYQPSASTEVCRSVASRLDD